MTNRLGELIHSIESVYNQMFRCFPKRSLGIILTHFDLLAENFEPVKEEGIETVDSTLSKEATVTDVEVGEKSVQITPSNDQVDNKSQQMMNEPEAIEMHLPQGFGGDELKIEKDTSTIIDIESHLVTDDQASAEIQKPSSITETLENLPRTPPRTQRLDANVSSSSEASHIDDVLRRENIFGKFKKTLRLSSDSIVSNYLYINYYKCPKTRIREIFTI